MTIGLKANNDGSGALQVNGTDRVTLSTAGVMSVPGGVTADVTGNLTGAADKLSTASGSAPSYSARAWVNFNGTGTVAIRASGNVSSITDNGLGDYTVNFTTAMSDANYCITGSTGLNAGGVSLNGPNNGSTPLTTSVRISTSTPSANFDPSQVNVAIFR